MEGSILYDLIFQNAIRKWRQEIEESDNCNLKKILDKEKDLLCAVVDEKNYKLVNHFKLAVENYIDYIFYCVDIKLINMCIKIGMELQKSNYDSLDE